MFCDIYQILNYIRLCTECRMTAGSTVPNLSSRTDQQTLSTHQLNTSFKGKYER